MGKQVYGKWKRFAAGSLAAATFLSALPALPALAAEDTTTTYHYDDYDVEYAVVGSWAGHKNILVTIQNNTDEPLYNWAFKYDAAGTIDAIWGAKTIDSKDSEYVIASEDYNDRLESTVTFGYILTCEDDAPAPADFEYCTERVDLEDGFETSVNVTNEWSNGYVAELVIKNTSEEPIIGWNLSFRSDYEIDTLWSADVTKTGDDTYLVTPQAYGYRLEPGAEYSVGLLVNMPKDEAMSIDSFALSACVIDYCFEINWEDKTDTDEDGIPDVYEKNIYNTDPKKADTDGDRLPDGLEVITLNTDPLKTDTDDNGVTDDNEDHDEDGLTNYEEFVLGTDSTLTDTDKDRLTDGDEVNVYGTDPLNPDTDGDTILDGDEVLLGLDPKNAEDGSTPVHQTMTAEELEINDYNTDFEISIDVDATNNFKRFVKQDVSEYAGILSDNRAIIGTPVSLKYNAGEITGGTITFTMNEEMLESAPDYYDDFDLGLARYGIFIYDEELNTLVPVAAEYDEENHRIAIEATYMGNLVIIDYESLMYDLGIDPSAEYTDDDDDDDEWDDDGWDMTEEESEDEDETVEGESTVTYASPMSTSVAQLRGLPLSEKPRLKAPSGTSTSTHSAYRQVDLVLVVDTTGSMSSQISTVKNNLTSLIQKLRTDNISLYVSLVDYKDITCPGEYTIVNNSCGKDFYNSMDDVVTAISGMRATGGGDGPETAVDGLAQANYLDYRSGAEKFLFLITDANYKVNNNFSVSSLQEIADMLHAKGIMTNVVATDYLCDYYYSCLLSDPTRSKIPMSGNFCDQMYEIIKGGSGMTTDYIILANSLVTGSFKSKLKYKGSCDTDGDTLTDSSEVDWDFVKELDKSTGKYKLYKWSELVSLSKWYNPFWSNPYEGSKYDPSYSLMSSIKVIPAKTNPFSADSDKDYYPDNIDENPLKRDAMYICDASLNDYYFHRGNPISMPASDKYTDGVPTVDNTAQTAKYVFTRRPNETHKFVIKPKSNSFYKFTNNAATSKVVMITHEEGAFAWKATETDIPESDGTYYLKRGEEYTISVSGSNAFSNYTFSVEQSNWVYAEKGGLQKIVPFNNYFPVEKMFIPQATLIDAIKEISNNTCTITPNYDDIDETTNSIMKQLGIDDSGKLIFDAVKTGVEAVIGGSATIAAIVDPEPTTKTILIALVADTLTVTDIIGAASDTFNFFEARDFKLACKDGNINLIYTKGGYESFNDLWAPWMTSNYINRFIEDSMNGGRCRADVIVNTSTHDVVEYLGWDK